VARNADAGTSTRPAWWWPTLGGIVAAAALLRLVHLGARPMHHDESLDAWFSWKVAHGQEYRYDPVYHGPLRFFVTAGFYRILGESEATARLLAALCGTGLVALVGTTRRWLGNVGSVAAAALIAVSPSMLYFSRFGREDMPFALCELAVVVLIVAWLRDPQPWHPPVFGAVLAAAFALKETSFILVAVVGLYLVLLGASELLDARRGRSAPPGAITLRRSLALPGWRAWGLGIAAFAFTFSMLFSVGFTHLDGVRAGALDGIRYWLDQQPVNRGAQPWPFYLAVLGGYEWLAVALGIVGAIRVVRHPDPVRGFVLWFAVAQLAVYSWASERFPWLVVHPLLPIVLLAGLGAEAVWSRLRRLARTRIPVPALAGLGAGALVLSFLLLAVPVVYRAPSDPRHLLVAVQTSDELLDVRDRVQARYLVAPPGRPPVVVIDLRNSATWPWAWYLRDQPVRWADLGTDPGAVRGADVVLTAYGDSGSLPVPPGGWTEVRPYPHRVWWLPPWDHASPLDWFDWAVTKHPFGGTGELESVELVAGNGW
jgi:uncharacterized protein (TIGR03663 family)